MTRKEIDAFLVENNLTRRKIEIVHLIKNRLSNRKIAEELFVAESTVKKNVSHIFEKLQVQSREELRTALFGIKRQKQKGT